MRISDWSSDVCSSDLLDQAAGDRRRHNRSAQDDHRRRVAEKLSTAMSHAYQAQLDANTPESVWSADTVYHSDRFAGTVALVSGRGSGIGRPTALLFARPGATDVICGRPAENPGACCAFAPAQGTPNR